ncbi:hypothetical protein HID58_038065, partial [Brassica napus]
QRQTIMSTNKSFTLLYKTKPYKNGWRVQVKLTHSPKQNPCTPDETLEIVFMKQMVKYMHHAQKFMYFGHNVTFLLKSCWKSKAQY